MQIPRKKSKLTDENGKYLMLELNVENENVDANHYIPKDPRYPDAGRYLIRSKETSQWLIIEDIAQADATIKQLKQIHGIRDPWDDDPNYFRSVPIPDPTAAFESLTSEEKDAVQKVLNWRAAQD
ncbi:MAG TPA: hypothetical protein PKL30_23750 [Leptospiraceae bacterium]|nr:hypothetical protein [Leptospiraceae bacterium]HMX35126.1 hypothetical protein [Leptospiraceae bacterium]HMY34422.1 hypothetical protein [Leptospiraceae bacterium]HMZ66841.1 hypothetical protein [Leptospiraceae bacterium]HNA10447.1 hypothetical protein [Leptospiraceae bacterium]